MSALDLARLHLEQGRPERALEALRREPQEESSEVWVVRAWSEFALERFDDASISASRGLALSPDEASLHLLRAEAARRTGRLVDAEAAILRALALAPDDSDLLCSYAKTVAAAGQLDKAEKLLARAESIDPGSANTRALRATLEWIRRPGGGERSAREALADDPDDVTASVHLALALSDRAHVHATARHARRAATADPTNADLIAFARETAMHTHWAIRPLWPIMRWGPMPVWIAGVVLLVLARTLLPAPVAGALGLLWLGYAIYSWVVPPLVRWRLRARRP